MKRFAIPIALALALGAAFQLTSSPKSTPPAQAQDLSGTNLWQTHMAIRRLTMRNTSAASVVRNPLWISRENSSGFADSNVYRRGSLSGTAYDTTIGYDTSDFPFPPTLGPTQSNAVADTSSVPWFIVRVEQDSVATGPYVFSGTSGNNSAIVLDSIRVAVEQSYDGINWFACSGTPTHRFDTVYLTSGQDGLQSPTLIGVENSFGEDMEVVPFYCHPSLAVNNQVIVNRTLAFGGPYIRFIIGMRASGQFRIEALTWAH